MTGKVVKVSATRKVGNGNVVNVQLKDLTGESLTIAVWNELGSKVSIDKVVEFINIRVDKYPLVKPHNLRTTAASRIKDKTEELGEEYKNVSLSDGKVRGVVECFYDVYAYLACRFCNCKQEKKICSRCKKTNDPIKDFKYEIMVKLDENDRNQEYDQLVGFKKTIPECGEFSSVPNAIEDFLNEEFQGKRVEAKFNYNKNDSSKIVLSLEFFD